MLSLGDDFLITLLLRYFLRLILPNGFVEVLFAEERQIARVERVVVHIQRGLIRRLEERFACRLVHLLKSS